MFGIALTHVGSRDLEFVDDAIETPRSKDPVARDDVQVTSARVLGKVCHGHRTAD